MRLLPPQWKFQMFGNQPRISGANPKTDKHPQCGKWINTAEHTTFSVQFPNSSDDEAPRTSDLRSISKSGRDIELWPAVFPD